MAILITGGAGYIGTHAMVEFLEAGREIVCVDNFSNSKPEALERVKKITGKDFKFYKVDLLDYDALEEVFKENDIDSCIHFAGLKAVGESCEKPLLYYHNNLTSTFNLCELLSKYGAKRIVFSSSATVYGKPASVPITNFETNKRKFTIMPTTLVIEPYLSLTRLFSTCSASRTKSLIRRFVNFLTSLTVF